MRKLEIILDSFAVRDKKYLDKAKIHYLPHYVYVDGKEYKDGINITHDDIIKYEKDGKNLNSSLPSPKNMLQVFEKIEKNNNDGLYLTMGSAISGTFQAAHILSKEYKHVYVMDNQFVGPQVYDIAIKKAQEMHKDKKSMNDIVKTLKIWNSKIFSLIIPINLGALVRSGRIGKSKAMLLDKMQIIPIIRYWTQVKVKWVKRTQKRALIKAMNMVKHYVIGSETKHNIYIGYAGSDKAAKLCKNELQKLLNIDSENIFIYESGPVSIVHLGGGVVCITAAPELT